MIAVILALLTFVSTAIGGIFALKNKSRLNLIMGFTSGVILGVVSFDIFPEIIVLVQSQHANPQTPMIALVVGFLAFHIVEKVILIHHSHENDYAHHTHPQVGILSALALSAHSFLDGIGIGIGFQISTETGILIALAVIGHDFVDGLNTVTLMLAHKNKDRKALYFLILDSVAPVLGAISTIFFKIPEQFALLYLGYFAGSLLYIGVSDILPQAHREKSSIKIIMLTVFGVLLMYILTQVISMVG